MSSSRHISAELAASLYELEARFGEAGAAPLSRKKAMLVALLVDRLVDRLAAAEGADDILVFRDTLAANAPDLALVLALAAMQEGGPRLVVEAVEVPLAGYTALGVEDFMVSLYNERTVQRVLIADADGTRHDAHATLGGAVAALRERAAARTSSAG